MGTILDTIFHRILSALNVVASVWILGLVAIISADVIGRSVFHHPIQGVPEIAKFSIIAMFWLQTAYVLRIGGHLRTTLGFDLLPPAGQKIVLCSNALIGFAIFALIVWLGTPEMMKSWRIGAFEGSDAARIPVWPFWAILVIGALLTSIQFLIDLWCSLRGVPREPHISAMPTVVE